MSCIYSLGLGVIAQGRKQVLRDEPELVPHEALASITGINFGRLTLGRGCPQQWRARYRCAGSQRLLQNTPWSATQLDGRDVRAFIDINNSGRALTWSNDVDLIIK
jgi:hypothetical protein